MNFPFAFGHPHDRYPSYPLYPSAMPWNYCLNFQMPIHPQYPQQHLPFFAPQASSNLFLNQQYNNFYAFDPNYSPSNINTAQIASFSRLMQPPALPKNEDSTTNTNRKRLVTALKEKDAEVLEVSDASSDNKKIIKKSKKSTATKEHRMFVELKRLSDKRFVKLDQNDRKNIEEELMDMAHKIGTDPKRPKRTSERTGSFQYEDHQERRKITKRQVSDSISHNQKVSIFNNTEIEVVLPRILTKSEFEQQRRTLKEALLIRSSQNL